MISPAFAAALDAARHGINARVRDARHRYPGFDTAALRAFLEDAVDGVVAAVAAADPARTQAVAWAACDLAPDLVGRALVGPAARAGTVNAVWRELLPRLAGLVAAQPDTVPALLTNAAIHLDGLPGVRTADWIGTLAALAPRIASVDELRRVGQVAAWRAGAAHFRAGALAAADGLPVALALAACAAPGTATSTDVDTAAWRALRAQLAADPWWGGGTGHEVGGFTGFGGPFAQPPQVRAFGEGFVVRAGERCHLLLADACGAVLLGASADEFGQSVPGDCAFRVDGTTLHVGTQRIVLDLPADGLRVCASGVSLALASPYTHLVRVLPREVRR